MATIKRPSRRIWERSANRALEEGVFNEAVQGRGGGTWSGALFGLAYGAVAGTAIAVVPGLFVDGGFGALSMEGIAGCAALCASIGALSGRTAGGENGSSAGAAVGSTKVLLAEMRAQFAALHQEIDSLKTRLGEPGAAKETEPAENAESLSVRDKGSYFKPVGTVLTTWAIGAAVGATMYAASVLLGGGDYAGGLAKELMGKIGYGGSHLAGAVGSALVGAMAGGVFVVNVPRITAELHMWARGAINGAIFTAESATPQVERLTKLSLPPLPVPEPEMPLTPGQQDIMQDALCQRVVSYQDFLATQREKAEQLQATLRT